MATPGAPRSNLNLPFAGALRFRNDDDLTAAVSTERVRAHGRAMLGAAFAKHAVHRALAADAFPRPLLFHARQPILGNPRARRAKVFRSRGGRSYVGPRATQCVAIESRPMRKLAVRLSTRRNVAADDAAFAVHRPELSPRCRPSANLSHRRPVCAGRAVSDARREGVGPVTRPRVRSIAEYRPAPCRRVRYQPAKSPPPSVKLGGGLAVDGSVRPG